MHTGTSRLLLAVLVGLGLLRAGAWAVLLEVPSPIDEVQHVAYVDTLLTEGRPPVIGHDGLPDAMADLAKASPTFAMRSRPVPPDPDDPGWGPVGASYEGGQTPLGYAPFVPVWAVARHLSPATGLLVLRLVAVVLAVLPLPLLLLAARRLFPRRPWVGPVAAVTYLAIPAAWSQTPIPAGDVLVPTAGLLALLAVVEVDRRSADLRSAVYVGAAAAGMLLVKPTTLGMVPVALLAGALVALRHRRRWRWAGWGGVAGAAAVLPLVPWLVWNLLAYGQPSGAEANDAILGGAQFDVPFGWDALRLHTQSALGGLFGIPRADLPWDAINLRWLAVLAVATVAGAVVAWRRGRRGEAVLVPALAASLPAAYGGMLVVIFVIFGGRSSVVGRHLLVALPLVCLAIAAGAVIAGGRRLGPAALLVVAAIGLWPREAALTERFVDTTYLEQAPDAALVAQHDLALRTASVDHLVVDAACPVAVVDVVTDGHDLPAVTTAAGDRPTATPHGSVLRPGWTRLTLGTPREHVDLRFAASAELPVTADGVPAHRVWCRHDTPVAATWSAMHDPLHPVSPSWSTVRATVWVLRWALPVLGLSAAIVLVGLDLRSRALR